MTVVVVFVVGGGLRKALGVETMLKFFFIWQAVALIKVSSNQRC